MAVESFPEVHVTGAVHHYVQLGNPDADQSIYYLGTAEVTPKVKRVKYGQDVFNDIAGKTLPFQRTRDGEDAVIAVLLSRFSQAAWTQILQAGAAAGRMGGVGGQEPGFESRWSRGGLIFGAETFKLWQVFEFGLAGSPNLTVGLPLGWYWPQVELLEHNDEAMGTQAEKVLLVMHAQPLRTPYSDQSNPGGFKLYSTDSSAFPADVLTMQ
jgi:hypothetical protein